MVAASLAKEVVSRSAFLGGIACPKDAPREQDGVCRAKVSVDADFWYGPDRPKSLGPFSAQTPLLSEGRFLQGPCVGAHSRKMGHARCSGVHPEVLVKYSHVMLKEPVWFKAGSPIFTEGGIDYLGNPNLVHTQSILAISAVQVVLMGVVRGTVRMVSPLLTRRGAIPWRQVLRPTGTRRCARYLRRAQGEGDLEQPIGHVLHVRILRTGYPSAQRVLQMQFR